MHCINKQCRMSILVIFSRREEIPMYMLLLFLLDISRLLLQIVSVCLSFTVPQIVQNTFFLWHIQSRPRIYPQLICFCFNTSWVLLPSLQLFRVHCPSTYPTNPKTNQILYKGDPSPEYIFLSRSRPAQCQFIFNTTLCGIKHIQYTIQSTHLPQPTNHPQHHNPSHRWTGIYV